jgi:L-ribulose-5-phosphate 3-epimerase
MLSIRIRDTQGEALMNLSTRRDFLKQAGLGATAIAAAGWPLSKAHAARSYGISLAGWSLHRTIGTGEGQLPMLDMPKISRQEFDIEAIELVNRMLASTDKTYIDQFIKNAQDNDVEILLIMIDGAGAVGAKSETGREKAVENHNQWIDIAHDMGCHSIRMNWSGHTEEDLGSLQTMNTYMNRCVPAFQAICEHGESKNINVLIENHWGPSSIPGFLLELIKRVDHPRFGTLPDFGNFPEEIDLYDAVDKMMPHAKAVSAKCYDFDDETGNETKLDYERLIANVHDVHGYTGYIGIEYEGQRLSEYEGIRACKKLLERLRA